jgi:hypothetical protein
MSDFTYQQQRQERQQPLAADGGLHGRFIAATQKRL